jgi:hypothetical protein
MKDTRRTIILLRLAHIHDILNNSKGKLSRKDREYINRFFLTLPTYMFRFVVQYIQHLEKHRKEKK